MTKVRVHSALKWIAAFAFIGTVYLADMAAASRAVRADKVPSDGSGVAVAVAEHIRADEQLDINTADLEQLTALPHIGEALAEEIVRYREQNGGFVSVEELKEIDGIGDGILEELRPYIRVS